jgi:hypothetical protein
MTRLLPLGVADLASGEVLDISPGTVLCASRMSHVTCQRELIVPMSSQTACHTRAQIGKHTSRIFALCSVRQEGDKYDRLRRRGSAEASPRAVTTSTGLLPSTLTDTGSGSARGLTAGRDLCRSAIRAAG